MFTTRTPMGTMLLRLLWVYVTMVALLFLFLCDVRSTCDIHWENVCIRVSTPTTEEN